MKDGRGISISHDPIDPILYRVIRVRAHVRKTSPRLSAQSTYIMRPPLIIPMIVLLKIMRQKSIDDQAVSKSLHSWK
jgi:hypothetical protein